MEVEKFTEKVDNLEIWLNANDVGAMDHAIRSTIEYGRTLTEEAEVTKVWESIRALCNTLPNSPIRKGKASSLPAEVAVLIEKLAESHADEMGYMWEKGNQRRLMCRLGEKRNGLYTQESLHEAEMRSMAASLKKRYNLGIWDGTESGLNSQDFSVLGGNE